MARSFDLVDYKVAEAEFFLKKIPDCDLDFFAVRCYVNAFVSSMRSVTFALQSSLRDLEGFNEWYTKHQTELKNNGLANFFNEFRRVNQHIGDNLVGGGAFGQGQRPIHFFTPTPDIHEVPSEDVESACNKYFVLILSIVFDCYLSLGPHIDPKQHYTEEHFKKIGKTIEDAEEELYGVRGWTSVPGYPDGYRWQALRDSQPGCGINHIFNEYLGKTTPEPERMPELPPPDGEGWFETKSGGRVYIPKEMRKTGDPDKDLELYFDTLRKQRNG